MRIVLVCDTYPPVLGGSEIEAQRVSAALIRAGHQVHVLCSGGPPMPAVREWIDPEGVPVSILTRTSKNKSKDLAFALRVASHILENRRNYDIVYFLMQGLHVAAGLPAARLAGIPVVMKISGDGIVSAMARSRAGRLELRLLRKWRLPLMLLNEAMFGEAIANGFPRDQLTWMPNPVDIGAFRPPAPGESDEWRTRHGLPLDAGIVIYTGRLSPEKGLRSLVGGFALAARKRANSVLLLIGDGPIRSELQELAQAQGLNEMQIRFIGLVEASQIPAWLRASDLFALTSPNEGFSCSLLEAMATGLPSLVSGIPANLQLVDPGVHGLTVRHDDEAGIGEAILRLLDHPAERSRMSRAARQRVSEKYSTERIVARYEALFSEAVKQQRP